MRKHFLVAIATIAVLVVSFTSGCTSSDNSSDRTATNSGSVVPPLRSSTTKIIEGPTVTVSPSQVCAYGAKWKFSRTEQPGNQMYGDVMSDDTTGKIYAIDNAIHDCFDRVVIRIDTNQKVGFQVEYVDVVRTPGRGDSVELAGEADLLVTVEAWTVNTDGMNALNLQHTDWPIVEQVVQAGSFEGQTTVGIGLDHQVPFWARHLPTEDGKMRIVIDFASQK